MKLPAFLQRLASKGKGEGAPSTMASRFGSHVGVDIGSSRIKLAVLAAQGGQPRVKALRDMPMPPAAYSGGTLLDPEGLGEEIATLLREVGAKKPGATLMVGGRDVFVRGVEMPRMEKEDAIQALPSHPRLSMMAFDVENNKIDVAILDPNVASTNMQVMMVAAKKDAIRAHQATAIHAGMKVAAVDADSFALFNIFEHCAAPGSLDAVTVVNIGERTSLILTVERGIPKVARHVDVAVQHLLDDMTESDEMLEESDARRLLFESSDPAMMYPQTVGRWMDAISDEVVRSSRQVQQRHAGARVFFTGGGALIDGLPRHVQQRIGVSTTLFNPLDTLPLDPGAALPLEKGPAYALALGLALRQVK
jgi:type IV pilus assembly protein PilM